MPEQLGLFESLSLNTTARFKAALREAVRSSGLSRDQVADQMTAIMKTDGLALPGNSRSISLATLDKWLADGARHQIPITLLPVFCSVTKSNLPFQALLQPLGVRIIDAQQAKVLQWGEAEIQKRAHAKKARKLADEIGL